MNKPRRAKSKRLLPLPLDESETKCGICLDEVVKRGKIGPCSHLYCYSCLFEWSRVNNTCPQCKLTFRCITRVDFATDSFEEKVFIKDKTLRTGHVSSDEEYDVHSPDIEDSDPDFIDYTEKIPDILSDNEAEAQFTQRFKRRKCSTSNSQSSRRIRGKSSRAFSDSDSSDENNENYLNILNGCQNSGLSPKSPRKTNGFSPGTLNGISPKMCENAESPELFGGSPKPSSSEKKTNFNSPYHRSISGKRLSFTESPTNKSMKDIYFTSPKYNKKARWARLDQKVRNSKRKRTLKSGRSTKVPVAISTLTSGSPSNCSKWLTTRKTIDEQTSPLKSKVNRQFKMPFKKNASPENLYEDPEQYFASIIDSED